MYSNHGNVAGITGTNPLLVARSSNIHHIAKQLTMRMMVGKYQPVIDRVAISKVLGKGDEDTIYVSGIPE